MLKSHFSLVERSLIATGKIVSGAGHSLHKGMPREAFIRDFLLLNLAETVGIGSGEIINSQSRPRDKRNQQDIILYRKHLPKLNFGGGVNAFMAESVFGTLEIKSKLTETELRKAVNAASATKEASGLRQFRVLARPPFEPPAILSYVVAYDGPASMKTVYNWICRIHASEKITPPELPPDINQRFLVPAKSVDMIAVLGKGVLYFDNSPIGILPDQERKRDPAIKWVWIDDPSTSLLFLFLHITQSTYAFESKHIDLIPYLANASMNSIGWGK